LDAENHPISEDAVCLTSSETVHEIFFNRDATNHPGGQPGSSNWYHYWSQTSARFGTHVYSGAASPYPGEVLFQNGAWVARIYNAAKDGSAGGCWSGAEGIDFFANVVRHEEQHRLDMNAIWGPVDRVAAEDVDFDILKDTLEAALFPGWPYDPNKTRTFPDTWGYNPPPLGQPLRDNEHYALSRQPSWTNGSANGEDWANPGMQHATIGDPDD
jgi:hypothetical protein